MFSKIVHFFCISARLRLFIQIQCQFIEIRKKIIIWNLKEHVSLHDEIIARKKQYGMHLYLYRII